ncbi:MAG: prepilin peptidase [Candidatus Bathyarchaeia archaeon]
MNLQRDFKAMTMILLPAFALLSISLFYDLRCREIPNFITIPAFLLSLALRLKDGDWALLFLFLLFLIVGSLPRPSSLFPLVFLGGGIASSFSPQVAPIWTAAFSAWLLGFMGAADSKIIITLSNLFPDILLAPFIFSGYFLYGFFLLCRKYRKRAIAVALNPTLGERTEAPALPGIFLGFSLYIAWRFLL